jgi:hypothetical protein
MPLYCPSSGPFDNNMRRFQSLMMGYNFATDPPTLGVEPFIFHIRGPVGSGKTTLANVMMHWIQKCRPESEPEWHRAFGPWKGAEDLLLEEQQNRIKFLEQTIEVESDEGDYCFVVIDNVLEGAIRNALNMYERLKEQRIVFMFLLSSHEPLLHKDWSNEPHDVQIFDTTGLTPEQALIFTKYRIDYYRVLHDLAVFEAFEIYPFRLEDISEAVSALEETPHSKRAVTIRMLNEALHNAIAAKRVNMGDQFNIANVSKDEATEYMISVILSAENRIRTLVA